MKLHLMVFFIGIFCLSTSAQEKAAETKKTVSEKKAEKAPGKAAPKKAYDTKRMIQVKLGQVSWNTNPENIDSGVVVLKDSRTNKIVQILLEETSPDSAVFSGTYWVNWGTASKVKPEVFVLNETKLLNEADFKKTIKSIQEGKVEKKPLFYRRNSQGFQILEVFNSKEESQAAMDLLKNKSSTSEIDLSSTTNKELSIAKAVFDAKELATLAEENKERLKESRKKVVDRYRSINTEKQKIAKIKSNFSRLPSPERDKKAKEAAAVAAEALEAYKANDFTQAEAKFKKSFDINPSEDKYYFQYGLSLYKNKKFDEAIIVLTVSKQNKEIAVESEYYAGICHYEMQEYEHGIEIFNKIKKSENEKFQALAAFYSGISYFDMKKLDEAKTEFNDVLDSSSDPKLDERSQKYIETIDQMVQFAAQKRKKFSISGSLGILYDSNVLQTSDSSSDQGSASELASVRYLFGLGFGYRPLFEKNQELSIKVRSDYIYTIKDDLSDYDPWSYQIAIPYQYRTAAFNRPYVFNIKPGYELLYLGQEEDGSPEKLLRAFFVDWGNTFVMNDNWIPTFSLNYRKDRFYEFPDKDATKWTLKFSNIYFLNKEKNKGIIGDLGYVINNAVGDDNNFKRIEMSALYLTPLFLPDMTFAGGLSLYQLKYPDKDPTQKDLNKALNANISKPIWESISATFTSSYTVNDSDVDTSEYDKWSIGLIFTGEYNF